jgi:uncharacterized membrane protein
MTVTHAISTPAPAPRWLLLASLALNLFLIGLIAALLLRQPTPVDVSVAGRIERLATDLPRADGDKLRDAFQSNRAGVEGARASFEETRDAFRAVLRREPFDAAALQEAMARSRAARQEFDAALQGVLARAAAEMSPAGRTALADWRPPHLRGRK